MAVVGYVRVSTEGQADQGVSLEAQRAKLEGYCALYELDLVEVIVDAGVSAKTLDRPGLARALGMLDDGTAGGILVAKLDRLTRSVRDLCDLVDRYFAGVRFALLSVAENVDTRTASGRMVLNILATISQWERETIGERTSEALTHLRARGVRLGGEALGWKRTEAVDDDGRRLVSEVDAEAETVRRIAELHASGLSLRAICAALDAEGRPTKRGGKWAPKTVRAVLLRTAA